MAEYVSKVVLGTGEVLVDLTADTVAADKLLTGITAHGADGAFVTGTCTFDSDTSEDTLTAAEAIVGKTFHARGTAYTGTMPNNGAVSGVITAADTPYTVPAGYHDGSGTVGISSADQSKLIPGNIKEGITILSVTGTYTGEGVTAQTKSVTPSFSAQQVLPDSRV